MNANTLKQLDNNYRIRYEVSGDVEVVEGTHIASARAGLRSARVNSSTVSQPLLATNTNGPLVGQLFAKDEAPPHEEDLQAVLTNLIHAKNIEQGVKL